MSQHDEVTNEHPQHDETSTIETLPDDRDRATDPDPSPAASAAWTAQTPQTGVPEFKSGPAPTTSVFGLLGLLAAIAVFVSQATDLDIPWGVVGPVAVVGAGVLLVLLGLAGLRGQRFRG